MWKALGRSAAGLVLVLDGIGMGLRVLVLAVAVAVVRGHGPSGHDWRIEKNLFCSAAERHVTNSP